MLLAREFVAYLARQIVQKLTPECIETANTAAVSDTIANLIMEELLVEDRLNDEVREILEQYSDYMRREGVSCQDMFRRIKHQMIAQRKVIRASGRDTGDHMKLSRDKITDISHCASSGRDCRSGGISRCRMGRPFESQLVGTLAAGSARIHAD